jgi:hypothetical protein
LSLLAAVSNLVDRLFMSLMDIPDVVQTSFGKPQR